MSTQVVRMARVGGAGGGLGKHIDGETRPESAAPRELDVEGGEKVALEPVVLLDGEGEQIDQETAKERVGAAQGYMRECRRKKTRGRQPMGATTWVFAGPPRYDGEKEQPWSAEKVRAWSKDCVEWLVDRAGPGSRLAHCALHQDEGAPHLHATLIRIRVEEERNRTRAAKVQAGQRIAQVLERADGEAAQRYRGRLDDATRATADAEGRATLATEERDEARRERDRAAEQRDRARATGEFTSELLAHLQRDNERLKRAEQVWEKRAAAQVAAAKQASADELSRVQQDVMAVRRERTEAIEQVGTLTVERDQARRERGQAAQEVKTLTVERDQAREDLAKRTAEVEDVKTDRNEWIDCFVRVVRTLDPGRTELEKAAARGGIKPEWLVQEVQRGRGGIDR